MSSEVQQVDPNAKPEIEIKVEVINHKKRNIRIPCTMRITDGYCFAKYEDREFARWHAKIGGYEYDEKNNLIVQEFPGLTIKEIGPIIMAEVEKGGGKKLSK